MPIYYTEYVLSSSLHGPIWYTAFVEARSVDELHRLIDLRNIGERSQERPLTTRHNYRLVGLIRARRFTEAVHEATFLSFVGLSAGTLTLPETVGDEGLVHELAHEVDIYDGTEKRVRQLVALARKLEKRVPGHPLSYDQLEDMPKELIRQDQSASLERAERLRNIANSLSQPIKHGHSR